MRTLRTILAASLIGATLLGGLAHAQGFPGGRGQDRGGNRRSSGNPDASDSAKRSAAASNPALTEPAIAIERELPSLRSDLLLDKSQMEAWTGFERSVRDAAQSARVRQRRIQDQRDAAAVGGVDLPPNADMDYLQDLIDDNRNRADLLANIAQALGSLAKVLDARQAAMINRRVVQSLRDPLGTG